MELVPVHAPTSHHRIAQQATKADPWLRRLQELVQRVGHLCLSPELAHAMVYPSPARDALRTGQPLPRDLALTCQDHASLLSIMADPDASEPYAPDARAYLREAARTELPARTTNHRQTRHLLAWRVKGPDRIVLFTGTHAQASAHPADTPPHCRAKTLVHRPSARPELAEVVALTHGPPTERDVRARVLHAGQTALDACFLERVEHRRGGALAHALEEAVLAFTSPAPDHCHTRIGLNQSQKWDKSHMDTR